MDNDPPIRISASDRHERKSRRERKRTLSVSIIVTFVLGIVFAGVFNMALEWTNREEFCIDCHEMKDNVYQEYRDSIHDVNRTGVRAVCVDCHLPKEFLPKILHKLKASNDIWHSIKGSIDTPEKFNEKRLELARREWTRLKANNSRECRNCHTAEAFNLAAQGNRAADQHQEKLLPKGSVHTCIDCHKGIAHQMPANATQADLAKPGDDDRADPVRQEETRQDDPTDQETNQAGSSDAATPD
jgi:cytochrome c-type protein NapC